MPKKDVNQTAHTIVGLATGQVIAPVLSDQAKAGRLGGLKGGKRRAETMSAEERKAQAQKAAKARWKT